MRSGSALAVPQRPPRLGGRNTDWHQARLFLAVTASVVLVLALAIYGFDYYRLDPIARVASPKHVLLRSSGTVGKPLGIAGVAGFLLIFLYALRKRWSWLARRGKTRHWLDFHVLLGLLAPTLITFHSAFKLQGIAGLAYWIMMSVVASGIVGRYLYAQIPRRLDAAEMGWDELQTVSSQLGGQRESEKGLRREDVARLLHLPSPQAVQAMPLMRALGTMVLLDIERPFRLWQLRRHAGALITAETVAALRRQAALSKKILFLSRAQQVFHLWHVVHRPFSYSLALLAALHIAVVLLLGY